MHESKNCLDEVKAVLFSLVASIKVDINKESEFKAILCDINTILKTEPSLYICLVEWKFFTKQFIYILREECIFIESMDILVNALEYFVQSKKKNNLKEFFINRNNLIFLSEKIYKTLKNIKTEFNENFIEEDLLWRCSESKIITKVIHSLKLFISSNDNFTVSILLNILMEIGLFDLILFLRTENVCDFFNQIFKYKSCFKSKETTISDKSSVPYENIRKHFDPEIFYSLKDNIPKKSYFSKYCFISNPVFIKLAKMIYQYVFYFLVEYFSIPRNIHTINFICELKFTGKLEDIENLKYKKLSTSTEQIYDEIESASRINFLNNYDYKENSYFSVVHDNSDNLSENKYSNNETLNLFNYRDFQDHSVHEESMKIEVNSNFENKDISNQNIYDETIRQTLINLPDKIDVGLDHLINFNSVLSRITELQNELKSFPKVCYFEIYINMLELIRNHSQKQILIRKVFQNTEFISKISAFITDKNLEISINSVKIIYNHFVLLKEFFDKNLFLYRGNSKLEKNNIKDLFRCLNKEKKIQRMFTLLQYSCKCVSGCNYGNCIYPRVLIVLGNTFLNGKKEFFYKPSNLALMWSIHNFFPEFADEKIVTFDLSNFSCFFKIYFEKFMNFLSKNPYNYAKILFPIENKKIEKKEAKFNVQIDQDEAEFNIKNNDLISSEEGEQTLEPYNSKSKIFDNNFFESVIFKEEKNELKPEEELEKSTEKDLQNEIMDQKNTKNNFTTTNFESKQEIEESKINSKKKKIKKSKYNLESSSSFD
ncbi:hypothetical protein CWI36_0031p0060 [Hamiltosporidium magnivora]|uniref:Uncharacterized protein n=1 Tax=Hamiltosporidium magnivora TaxID=148818 RepID=A0A4Q9LMB0_9MICR|nr:hypothetical protein CWI36_0031p0060 [Hamiltosporidium magnivora]